MSLSVVTLTQLDPLPLVQIGSVYPQSIVIRQVEAGPAGSVVEGTGDLNYTHPQGAPASVWTINHNLGKCPSVVVIDSANTQWEGEVAYPTLNQMTVTFSAAFSGTAYLN